MSGAESRVAISRVEAYLAALGAGSWSELEATLAEDVVRVGPYGDRVEGSAAYAAFLEEVVTSLPGYQLEIKRVRAVGEDVLVELAETIDSDGGRLRTEEALVLSVDSTGAIARLDVYIQSPRAARAR